MARATTVRPALAAPETTTPPPTDVPAGTPTPTIPPTIPPPPVVPSCPLFLPKCLARVVDFAAKESTRYSMGGVRLQVFPGDSYCIEATDGRVLLVVRGASVRPIGANLIEERLTAAPNGATVAMIPSEDWVEAMKMGVKDTHGSVGFKISADQVTVANHAVTRVIRHLDGRFPDVRAVAPKGKVAVSFSLNPAYLARSMKVFEALGCLRVSFHVWRANMPIGLVGHQDPDLCVSKGIPSLSIEAVIMPLT